MFLKAITYDDKGVLSISANTGDGEATFKTESPHSKLSDLFDSLSSAVAAWLMPDANTFGLEGVTVTRDKNGIHSAVIAYGFTSRRHPSRIQKGKLKGVVLLESRGKSMDYLSGEITGSEYMNEEIMADLFNGVITRIETLSEWASENWLEIEHRVEGQMNMFDGLQKIAGEDGVTIQISSRGTKATNE